MKKTALFFLLIAAAATSAQAAEISSSQAEVIAASFVKQNTMLKSAPGLTLASAGQSYYAFNAGQADGYVIVAADDAVQQPVLGYADSGSFDEQNPELQWWLSEVARMAAYASAGGQQVTTVTTSTRRVKPLLGDILWNQGAPYNLKCPTYTASGTTKTAVTGCVATAYAQIMRYHQWPEKGSGSYSYDCNLNGDSNQKTTLSADFSQDTYDWANMPGTLTGTSTTAQKEAVSLLMRDCGYAVNMGYGASSGAVSRRVLPAMAGYFGYDKGMRFLCRDAYKLADWCSIIDGELQAGRPVFYTGHSSSGGGHAFVLDGADGRGYYHINWGWGGTSNGYFLIPDLTPKQQGIGGSNGGFINSQAMIVGIKKNTGTSSVTYSYTAQTFDCGAQAVKLGSKVSLTVGGFMPAATMLSNVSMTLGVGLYDAKGNLKSVVARKAMTGLRANYNYSANMSYTPPKTLAQGTYTLRLVANNLLATGTWTPVDVYLTSNPVITMRVADGNAIFTAANHETNLKVTRLDPACNAYANRQLLVNATLRNTGVEYFGDVSIALLDATDSIVAQTDPLRTVVASGDTTAISLAFATPSTAGTYTLAVLDAGGLVISGLTKQIKVAARPAAPNLGIVSQLAAAGSTMSASCIQGQATIKNVGGAFTGQVEVMILPQAGTGNTVMRRIATDFVEIGAGQTKTLRFKGDFPAGTTGKIYRLVMRNPTTASNVYQKWGNTLVFTVRDAVPGDVNADGVLNVDDVTTQITGMLGGDPFPCDDEQADQDGNGMVNVNDVTDVINLMLAK